MPVFEETLTCGQRFLALCLVLDRPAKFVPLLLILISNAAVSVTPNGGVVALYTAQLLDVQAIEQLFWH